MAGKADAVRSSAVVWDGAGVFHITSGRLTNAAAAQFGVLYVAPCDLYLDRVWYYIDTQFTHADAALNIGSVGNDDAYVDNIDLTNDATGFYELDMESAVVVLRRIPKGTVFGFSLDASDTTGKITCGAVLVPYDPE